MKPFAPKLAPTESPLERTPEEWAERLQAWGQPKYRAVQIFRWIHRRGVFEADAMSDLPKALRDALRDEGLTSPAVIDTSYRSEDGTRKFLLRFADDRKVESVLIPQDHESAPQYEDEGIAAANLTQCISSQVGCAMGCGFCASGVAGLKRNMTAAEIVSQVLLARAALGAEERVKNLVLMGMGEPLHNYDAVARALVLLTHPEGLDLSMRRITLSTSGLVPQLDRLAEDFGGHVPLAVSVHAPTNRQRSALMPINRKHPLEELMQALRRYPTPRRRRITIEYTLIEGFNDALRDADGLVECLRGLPTKINLIPMNPIEGSALRPPAPEAVDAFQDRLREAGLAVFVRKRRGDDIAAACGQLALSGERAKVRSALSALPVLD